MAAPAFFWKRGLELFEERDERRIPQCTLIAVFTNSGGQPPLLKFHGEPSDQLAPALSLDYSRGPFPGDDGIDHWFQNAGDIPEGDRG